MRAANLLNIIQRMSSAGWRLLAAVLLSAFLDPAFHAVSREDLFVNTTDGIRIHVREVRVNDTRVCEPILLVHGARVPGVASFDLPVAGGSLAEDFGANGMCAYVIDIRGYGESTRPKAMEEPAGNHPPLVRSVEAAEDIDAAIDLIRQRSGRDRISLFGWATGGQWAGYYATLHSEKLSHLILLNALYGADAPHALMGHGSDMEDPAHAGHLNPQVGAYRCNTAASLTGVWDRTIPLEDKTGWRDPWLPRLLFERRWPAIPIVASIPLLASDRPMARWRTASISPRGDRCGMRRSSTCRPWCWRRSGISGRVRQTGKSCSMTLCTRRCGSWSFQAQPTSCIWIDQSVDEQSCLRRSRNLCVTLANDPS